MAESFASLFADSLLRKVASNACEEASRAYGVFEDLQGIKDTLSNVVETVLSDAEKRKDQSYALREWLRQVQNICYDAEDVLEELELQDKRKQVVRSTGMKVGCLFSSSNPQLVFRLRIAREIKEIRHKLDKLASDRTRLRLPGELARTKREMTDFRVDASSVIGRENDREDIFPEQKLSYDQMPSYLKQCFAYFSLYPKDFTFNSDEITSLWVALGLVYSWNGSEKLEDIARGYIEELNSRSFLEDFVDYGYYCTFRVNRLMHDLALYVSKEEFVVVNSRTLNIPVQARHISIVENVSPRHAFFPKSKSVRTILFPSGGVGLDSESLLDMWISRYKYLRVLDLSNSSFKTLPNSIAKLEYLRILDLSYNCKIKRLPPSICNLQNLQVLSLNGCKELEKLPEGLRKLISLRQLFITTKQYVLSLNEFASLNHLRALKFCWCDNLTLSFSEKQLTSLETLIIQSCGNLKYLPIYIFPRLQTLFIVDCAMISLSLKDETIQRLMMKHLHLVEFSEFLALPRWVEGAANTLETLVIYKFPKLKRLPECLTTMTHLKKLHIVACPQLLSLPGDMRHLTALEDLVIDDCPELCGKYQPQSGECWPMIAHIKSIFIGKPRLGGQSRKRI